MECLKILIVEDDPIYAHFVASTLQQAGHETVTVRDARSAIEQARKDPPNGVVLDLRLPDDTGYAVARQLRDGILDRRAIIIILTAEQHPQLDPAHAADVDLVLTKPVDAALVRGLVEHVSSRRATRTATRG